ncbi:MAG: metallophosphoesterase family protein [Gemmatimonadetes bacterium]|jgi:acid phosphatase type 7|nr:metallophosphoesterase family protein [Gemmatimonadota bacterium]
MLSILKGPYLQWPTRNSITVMWETSEASTSTVTYRATRKVHSGLNGGFETLEETEKVVEDSTPCCIHSVTLIGLESDSTYHYRVHSDNSQGDRVESAEHPLKTAVGVDRPFSFAVTSETGGYGDDEINRRVFGQIRRFRPEFLLVVGDAVRNGSQYEDWERWFFDPGRELFADTPFFLCPGNHEENASWFYEFVGYPEPKNFYSFDYGNVHFVALDSTRFVEYGKSGPIPREEFEPGSAQHDFLVDDLQGCKATWKIVFFHYPPYVSGDYQVEEMRALCPVLEEHGVDLVLNSHTIVYERSHPLRDGRLDAKDGIVYVVAGGAGAAPNWFHHKWAWHTAQALAVPHFVQVVIAGDTLELRAMDDEGRLFDTMKLTK